MVGATQQAESRLHATTTIAIAAKSAIIRLAVTEVIVSHIHRDNGTKCTVNIPYNNPNLRGIDSLEVTQMNQEELIMAREVRRYLERRPIDSTLAVVNCHKGVVTISGYLQKSRFEPTVDLEEEIAAFTKYVSRNVRNVRSVLVDARIARAKKIQKEELEPHGGASKPAPAFSPPAGPKINLPGRH